MRKWTVLAFAAFALLWFIAGAALARAAGAPDPPTDPPADLCSVLPASQMSSIAGQSYDAPQKTVAPRPYANTVEGSDCRYKKSNGEHGDILLRAYADPSPSDAAALFAKLGLFYSPQTPVRSGVEKRGKQTLRQIPVATTS